MSGCAAVKSVTAGDPYYGSRCGPTSACAPTASPLRQYFDVSQHKYYYYDPSTFRYYWENGAPKT